MSTQIINNGTQVLGNNENVSGGTQVFGGGTQIINNDNLSSGTQIINNVNQSPLAGTQIIGDSTTGSIVTFAGGLLIKGSTISGWTITDRINVQSGEADLYIAEKNGEKGVIKYYRGHIHPKTDLLEKLVGLKHPDIINLYEYGEFNGHFYEIMEYAAGGSLDTRNEDGSYKYLPLSEDKVIQVCMEVINSYKTCHEKGIIHRDIKPANIYYKNADGTDIVIGDFGISSLYDENEIATHKTQTASRTTGYAAPEVLSGIISPKMDYYALGITLWELSTGKDPFVMENGKRRNEAHLLRDTIQGRIADDLLSRDPKLSDSMQHLIRGLLVTDDKNRWGYDEVVRHLNGEKVEVVRAEIKDWEYSIENDNCTTLEQVGNAILKNIESVNLRKEVGRGFLASFFEDKYPEVAQTINKIFEEDSGDMNLCLKRIALYLTPSLPYFTKNGYKIENIDDIVNLIINAPEELIQTMDCSNKFFYIYLKHIGYEDEIPEIQNLMRNIQNESGFMKMLNLGKVALLLKDNAIKPFKLEKYKDITLTEFEQLSTIPKELQDYIISIIKNKSFDGLLLPWLLTSKSFLNISAIKEWKDFLNTELSELENDQLGKAIEFLYSADEVDDALRIVKPIYQNHVNNEEVYNLYIWIQIRKNSKEALKMLNQLRSDSVHTYNAKIFINLKNNNFIEVKSLIDYANEKWADNVFLKTLNMIYMFKLYKRDGNKKYLINAENIINKISKPKNKVEFSWIILVQNLLRMLKGEEYFKIDKQFCMKNNLYFTIVNQTLELEY